MSQCFSARVAREEECNQQRWMETEKPTLGSYLMENAKFEMVLSENNVSRDDQAYNNGLLQQQNWWFLPLVVH